MSDSYQLITSQQPLNQLEQYNYTSYQQTGMKGQLNSHQAIATVIATSDSYQLITSQQPLNQLEQYIKRNGS